MVKTREDIRRVEQLIDRLIALGVSADIILSIRTWLNKEATRILTHA